MNPHIALATIAFFAVLSWSAASNTNKVVLVSSGGAEVEYDDLAAAFANLQNNQRILIWGTHTIVPQCTGGMIPAPLDLNGKTNVSIVGVAGAQIYAEGAGDFMSITDSRHVLVDNIEFRGTKPDVGEQLYAMILLRGTNAHIRITDCRFSNFGNHGISHLFGDKTSTRVTVDHCEFYNGGSTNVPSLLEDGAAISGIGSHWDVSHNYIENCVRGIEVEGPGPTLSGHINITQNTIKDTTGLAIMVFPMSRSAGQMHDIQITGNQIEAIKSGRFGGFGVLILGGQRINVRGNVIRRVANVGVSISNDFTELTDSMVVNNTIADCNTRGIQVAEYNRGPSRVNGVAIQRNTVVSAAEAGIQVSGANIDIANNSCKNNAWSTVSAGIKVQNSEQGSTGLVISDNRCTDLRANKLQNYGIWIASGVSGAVVRDNWCAGNQDLAFRDDGLKTKFSGNTPGSALQITSHPQSRTNLLGTTARFTVAAQGVQSIRYQWRKNGIRVAGATNAAYNIINVQPGHSGNYSVVVSNGFLSRTSNVARLTVGYPISTATRVGSNFASEPLSTHGDEPNNRPLGKVSLQTNQELKNSPSPVQPAISGGNGHHVFWQAVDGTIAIWAMDHTNIVSSSVLSGNPSGEWRGFGIGDFNQDGKWDMAFQNSENFNLAVWFSDGTNLTSHIIIAIERAIIEDRKALAVKDFNKDGRPDLLMQDSDGSGEIWILNGTTVVEKVPLVNEATDPKAWRMKGAADFNGDEYPEIVWHHPDGQTAICNLFENTIDSTTFLPAGPPQSSGWSVEGAGDWDKNGTPDLLWCHVSGYWVIWLLESGNVTSTLQLTEVKPGWRLVAPR